MKKPHQHNTQQNRPAGDQNNNNKPHDKNENKNTDPVDQISEVINELVGSEVSRKDKTI